MAEIAMTAMYGKGRELNDLLRRELGIPAGVQWFEVRFGMDELVTVKCQYVPRPRDEDGKR
jgi:hypothetical protein